MPDEKSFREKLETLINEHSMEAGSNTPDFILAEFLADSLRAFDKATTARALWYGSGVQELRVLNCLEPGLPLIPKPFNG